MGWARAGRGGRRLLRAEADSRPQAELRVAEPKLADLFHITDRAAWAEAAAAGEYRVSTRGVTLEEEGFIHCSDVHQLRRVAEQFYADADDLVVLVIDSTRVIAPIRYEASASGDELYPHIYGPVPADAVAGVLAVRRDPAGRFILPD